MWIRKKQQPSDAEKALSDVTAALEEARGERDEVREVSTFHRMHRLDNHWSKRVDLFLKGRQV